MRRAQAGGLAGLGRPGLPPEHVLGLGLRFILETRRPRADHSGRAHRQCEAAAWQNDRVEYPQAPVPSFLFDLDGTLIDSVYQHVIAWRAALSDIGIDLSVWRIHRRIGMSGGLFVQALLRETGRTLSAAEITQLQQAHAVEYRKQMGSVTALPGAR